jgi:hypothetical protein
MSELISDSQANPGHSLGDFVLGAQARFPEFASCKRIGGFNPTGRCSQSIQCLTDRLGHSDCMSCVPAECKLYLSKAGKKLADKLRFFREAIKGRVDTIRPIRIAVAHGC